MKVRAGYRKYLEFVPLEERDLTEAMTPCLSRAGVDMKKDK
jgi:hypothetical protein